MNNTIDQLIRDNSSALLAYSQLPWYSRWMKKGALHADLLQRVKDVFQNALNLTQNVFGKVWGHALATHRIQWTPKKPLTREVLQAIESSLRETLVYHGKGFRIEWKPNSNSHVHGHLSYLLGKDHFSTKWLDDSILKAIFVKKNPEILRCMRKEMKNVLKEASKHLPVVGSPQEILFQTFIGNCLAILPYSYPEAGEEYLIPQKFEGQWKVCKYIVNTPIELTPSALLTPIYAFGLTSLEGPPLLTIIGTTYPGGDGFAATIMSDTTPCMSVGHAAYLLGQKKITAWLEGKEQVRLFGSSLGGALCFQVLRHHAEKIAQVDAYNPPGLYPWNWSDTFDEQKVNIYYQENDLVASMGIFPTGRGVSIYRVFRSGMENCLSAHARAYAGSHETTIIKSSPEYENSRCSRKALIAAHLLMSPIAGFICFCFLLLTSLGILLRTSYPFDQKSLSPLRA